MKQKLSKLAFVFLAFGGIAYGLQNNLDLQPSSHSSFDELFVMNVEALAQNPEFDTKSNHKASPEGSACMVYVNNKRTNGKEAVCHVMENYNCTEGICMISDK